ncbi:MAG: hypothetical protein WA794_05930 [Trebonia sp.]
MVPRGEAVTERQMFGGVAFMLGGHMFCGVRAMDFTGRPMKGMIFVDPEGLHGDALRQWVDAGVGYACGLPPKHATPARERQ